ncbi:hypothetical protein ACFVTC_39410 [Streptomyces sp. NPDC057950]|uniref:hypothetical protein n=1 Tax=Streptomyces sp. NPDC057950 TaxID=3346288 RepID=UPI0036EF2292
MFDKITLGTAVFVSVATSVLDFTGAIDGLPWLKERIPVMTLLVVGVTTLSILIDGDRLISVAREANRQAQEELAERLAVDPAGITIMRKLNARWQERQLEIHHFFNETVTVRSERVLIDRLTQYQHDFSIGQMAGGARTRFPWDLTVAAMDLSGRFSYHPNPVIQGTRPNQSHHARILQERNGECFWVNQFITPQLRQALGTTQGDEFKHDRLTRVYYRYNKHLNIICIIESHIDVLYQLPRNIGE